MVTYLQFYNAVRSYNYRTKLSIKMYDLEQRIIEYINERDLKNIKIPGYYIDVSEGKTTVIEQPLINLNQLYLEFYEKYHDDGNGLK